MEQCENTNAQIIVASHRRSGTHLTIDCLINNFACFDRSRSFQPLNLDDLCSSACDDDSAAKEFESALETRSNIWKTHSSGDLNAFFRGAFPLVEQILARNQLVYVHRDGRDVLVSLFNYRKRYDQGFSTITFGKFIRQPNDYDIDRSPTGLNRIEYWAWHARSWLSRDPVMLSYDSVRDRFRESLNRLASVLDQTPKARQFNPVKKSRGRLFDAFDTIRLRLLKPVMKTRHTAVLFDQGVSGRWRDYFSSEDLKLFDECGGETNRLLGYAPS